MRWTVLGGHPRLWHNWFAWRPVRIGNEMVWLEIVQRKAETVKRPRVWTYRTKPFKGLLP
jgi:hypothetical protein